MKINTRVFWGAVGIVSQLLFLASWLVAESWQGPQYSIIRDTISDLGARTAPHAWIFIAGLFAAGLGTIGFSLCGLRPALADAGRKARHAPWMLALSGLGFGNLMAVFQIPCRAADGCTQAERSATFGGMQDATLGFLVIILLAATPLALSRRLQMLPRWHPLARLSFVTSLILIACILGAVVPSVQGLFERILAVVAAVWVVHLSANLIRISKRMHLD